MLILKFCQNMTSYQFVNKAVLITGSSRGVGRATAQAFAAAGARVCLHYHQDAVAAKKTFNELSGAGHAILQADMADIRQVKVLVKSAIQKLGRIDILVNNAGVFQPHDINQLSFDDYMQAFQRTLSVNLLGPAAACHIAAEQMRQTGGGKIINVGSRGAFRGEEGQPGYGAAKAGLHAMSQSLARALGPHGITVHAVAPGFIETAMARPHLQGEAGELVKAQSPLNRVATVDEVAQAILFLSSEQATFTTGCVLDLNGASYLH